MGIEVLHDAISAVCPIDGVSVGRLDDKRTWSIQFKDIATKAERIAGNEVLASFDKASIGETRPISRDILKELDTLKADMEQMSAKRL